MHREVVVIDKQSQGSSGQRYAVIGEGWSEISCHRGGVVRDKQS